LNRATRQLSMDRKLLFLMPAAPASLLAALTTFEQVGTAQIDPGAGLIIYGQALNPWA
jgi:hypothetical protein